MSGFVYVWRDKKHNRYYVGSHWGHEDDGYICSSTWMRNAYNRRKEDFKRRIVARILTNRQDLLTEEHRWLQMICAEEVGSRFYNLSRTCKGMIRKNEEYTHSAETRKRISESNKGKKLSEATKEKIRIARSKQVVSEETKEKIRQANLKREYGDEFKATMKEVALNRPKDSLFGGKQFVGGMIGKSHSDETKQKMAAKAKYKVSCPHCGKEGSANPMRRWHFNNCKSFQQENIKWHSA